MAAWLALWSRRILLALLALLSFGCIAGAVIVGHAAGAVAWAVAFLLVMALSAVLFGERYVSKPAAVIAEASKLLKLLPIRLEWLTDLAKDKASGVIPEPQADALAKAISDVLMAESKPKPSTIPTGVTTTGEAI